MSSNVQYIRENIAFLKKLPYNYIITIKKIMYKNYKIEINTIIILYFTVFFICTFL